MLRNSTFILFLILTSCASQENLSWYRTAVHRAEHHYANMVSRAREQSKYPRSTEASGNIKWVGPHDWTSGFFPGSLWYLYELTGKDEWKLWAEEFTEPLAVLEFDSSTHDLGFMMYCSFGNGFRLTNNDSYARKMINGANSLSSRFKDATGCIRSWDFGEWQYPVIIDNMMNLEFLLWATQHSGNEAYKEVALAHANTTLTNHFRKDYSSYHVIDYDSISGKAIWKGTFQGYADESAWSRGQAWAVYGYTVMYRVTKEKKYRDHAEGIVDFFLNHPNLPADKIPYWDFDAPNIPEEPKDASAAAVLASALFELMEYTDKKEHYFTTAETILKNLSRAPYLADEGLNNNFILLHSTGSKPHNSEVNQPLNYADYYYLEALKRYDDLMSETN